VKFAGSSPLSPAHRRRSRCRLAAITILTVASAAAGLPTAPGVESARAARIARDTTPPSAPTNLTATATVSTVSLSWTASTDNVRVDHYNVWRSVSGSGTWTRIASTSAPSHTDSTVSTGTTYVYGVRAVDAAGNTSASSNLVKVTPVASVPSVRTIFDGSVFGPVPSVAPYAAAGSQGASYSLTDPNTHGAVVVSDPAGSLRQLIKLTTDEAKGDGSAVRMQLTGPKLLGEGSDVWIVAEYYFPANFPTLPSDGWLTLSSVYGAPHGGAGPNSIQVRNLNGQNYLHWKDEAGNTYQDLWRQPATRGEWHVLARHMYMSSDAAKGFMELWYARRGQPLQRQTLQGPAAGQTRRYYRTLEPGVNWDTDPSSPTYHQANSANLSNYHKDNMVGWSGLSSVYVAAHKLYPGTAGVQQVDPYNTGD
jgi:Polysaccharide lyase/Fibronectin type III domain